MAQARLDTPIPKLRALVGAGHYKDQSDSNLLERFVATRDELAFKTLMRRHGPLHAEKELPDAVRRSARQFEF